MNAQPSKIGAQRGSAMIAAIFLIVVLAALGVFAMRVGADQQQTANLQLLQYRANAAANSGLEFWANRAAANPTILCANTALNFNAVAGLRGFNVDVSCTRIDAGPLGAVVYEVTADATTGVFGSPDFVRRQATRRMTNIAGGSW